MKRSILSLLLLLLALAMQAQIQEQPIDREATGPTRQLYRYLRDKVWGKQVLSGCQAPPSMKSLTMNDKICTENRLFANTLNDT